jgi:hypothetical protein
VFPSPPETKQNEGFRKAFSKRRDRDFIIILCQVSQYKRLSPRIVKKYIHWSADQGIKQKQRRDLE